MQDTTTTATTTETAPAALAARSFEVMAGGDLDDFVEIVHPRATNREAVQEPPATRGQGPAAFHATALWLRSAYADLRWEIHDTIEHADLVVVHVTMSGRHTGPFVTYDADGEVERAFPPTGRTFAVTQSHWFRIAEGQVVEHWANRDDMGNAIQLGWIPPTPAFLIRSALATRRARKAAAAA
jgi:predicted ester cyclase